MEAVKRIGEITTMSGSRKINRNNDEADHPRSLAASGKSTAYQWLGGVGVSQSGGLVVVQRLQPVGDAVEARGLGT